MSQITVENIKRSTETAIRSTRGVAAAWVNFSGQGTVAVRDSENVSSLTDNGTGDYTVNFSSVFGAADYAFFGAAEITGFSTSIQTFNMKDNGTFKLSSSFRGEAMYVDSGTNRTNFDPHETNFLSHGGLA